MHEMTLLGSNAVLYCDIHGLKLLDPMQYQDVGRVSSHSSLRAKVGAVAGCLTEQKRVSHL